MTKELETANAEKHTSIPDKVVTVCYGKRQEWDAREDAIRFFMLGMSCSEGSELERYANIISALEAGEMEAFDYDENE